MTAVTDHGCLFRGAPDLLRKGQQRIGIGFGAISAVVSGDEIEHLVDASGLEMGQGARFAVIGHNARGNAHVLQLSQQFGQWRSGHQWRDRHQFVEMADQGVKRPLGQMPEQDRRRFGLCACDDGAVGLHLARIQIKPRVLGHGLQDILTPLRKIDQDLMGPDIPCCPEVEQRAVLVEQNRFDPRGVAHVQWTCSPPGSIARA